MTAETIYGGRGGGRGGNQLEYRAVPLINGYQPSLKRAGLFLPKSETRELINTCKRILQRTYFLKEFQMCTLCFAFQFEGFWSWVTTLNQLLILCACTYSPRDSKQTLYKMPLYSVNLTAYAQLNPKLPFLPQTQKKPKPGSRNKLKGQFLLVPHPHGSSRWEMIQDVTLLCFTIIM